MSTQPIEEDLDAFLDDAERPPGYHEESQDAPEGADPRAPWRIEDDGAADWALRQLGRVLARREQVDRFAKERTDTIKAWHAGQRGSIDHKERRWRGLLERYALERRELTGQPGVKLPNGTLTTLLQNKGGRVDIADPPLLKGWLNLHPEIQARWCKIDPEPQVSRFKDEVQIVDGSLCRYCGGEIIRAAEPEKGDSVPRWLNSSGRYCAGNFSPIVEEEMPNGEPMYSTYHAPVHDEEGELRVIQVAATPVVGTETLFVPVPGLRVRPETIKPGANV